MIEMSGISMGSGKNEHDLILEMQKDLRDAAIKHFGCHDPVFKNGKEAEKALHRFFNWYDSSYAIPAIGMTPDEAWEKRHGSRKETLHPKLDMIYDATEVGIIFDEEAGMGIAPDYGFVKMLLEGEKETIKNADALVRDIVKGLLLPPHILKKLLRKNEVRAVRVFGRVYPQVRTADDLDRLMKKHQREWDIPPKPGIKPVHTADDGAVSSEQG